jgi:hypothetical protein
MPFIALQTGLNSGSQNLAEALPTLIQGFAGKTSSKMFHALIGFLCSNLRIERLYHSQLSTGWVQGSGF